MFSNQPNNLRDFAERNRQRDQERMKMGMWDAQRRKQKSGGGSPAGGCYLGSAILFLLLLPFRIILVPIKLLAKILGVALRTVAVIVLVLLLVIVVAPIIWLLSAN